MAKPVATPSSKSGHRKPASKPGQKKPAIKPRQRKANKVLSAVKHKYTNAVGPMSSITAKKLIKMSIESFGIQKHEFLKHCPTLHDQLEYFNRWYGIVSAQFRSHSNYEAVFGDNCSDTDSASDSASDSDSNSDSEPEIKIRPGNSAHTNTGVCRRKLRTIYEEESDSDSDFDMKPGSNTSTINKSTPDTTTQTKLVEQRADAASNPESNHDSGSDSDSDSNSDSDFEMKTSPGTVPHNTPTTKHTVGSTINILPPLPKPDLENRKARRLEWNPPVPQNQVTHLAPAPPLPSNQTFTESRSDFFEEIMDIDLEIPEEPDRFTTRWGNKDEFKTLWNESPRMKQIKIATEFLAMQSFSELHPDVYEFFDSFFQEMNKNLLLTAKKLKCVQFLNPINYYFCQLNIEKETMAGNQLVLQIRDSLKGSYSETWNTLPSYWK